MFYVEELGRGLDCGVDPDRQIDREIVSSIHRWIEKLIDRQTYR